MTEPSLRDEVELILMQSGDIEGAEKAGAALPDVPRDVFWAFVQSKIDEEKLQAQWCQQEQLCPNCTTPGSCFMRWTSRKRAEEGK
jgi:hypothetical protein